MIPYFIVNDNNTVAIEINKNGMPYRQPQTTLSGAGQIVAFGPDLEFVAATSEPIDTTMQSGLLLYNLAFPSAGPYKLFMQTQAKNQVSTFDYNVTVRSVPISTSTKEVR